MTSRLDVLPASLRKPSPWLTWPLRAAVLLGLLGYILHDLDFSAVAATLGRLPPWIFPLGVLLMFLGQAQQALRWKLLLRNPGVRYLDCLAFVGLGAAIAMVSPSSVLADGVIAYWLGRRRHNVAESMSALALSRLFGALSMAALCLSMLPGRLWVLRGIAFGWAPGDTALVAAAAALLAALALVARRKRAALAKAVDRVLPALRDRRRVLAALALSVSIQLSQFLALHIGYRAMGVPVSFPDLVFFWPLISLAGLLPVSIGGLGVRESLGIFFFTMLPGVAKEHVLAHAGYMYAVFAGLAGVNGLLAAIALGRRGG
jgi:uncharacterized membrane protein YbhN (UPF0104 family)